MSIVVDGTTYRTLRDPLYVNDEKVYEVYVNDTKVYPEKRYVAIIEKTLVGETHSYKIDQNLGRYDVTITYSGNLVLTVESDMPFARECLMPHSNDARYGSAGNYRLPYYGVRQWGEIERIPESLADGVFFTNRISLAKNDFDITVRESIGRFLYINEASDTYLDVAIDGISNVIEVDPHSYVGETTLDKRIDPFPGNYPTEVKETIHLMPGSLRDLAKIQRADSPWMKFSDSLLASTSLANGSQTPLMPDIGGKYWAINWIGVAGTHGDSGDPTHISLLPNTQSGKVADPVACIFELDGYTIVEDEDYL